MFFLVPLQVSLMPRAAERRSRTRSRHRKGRSRESVARAFTVGCREGNLEILRMLPTSVPDVMKRLGVTKMPANRRINDLMEVGLLERDLGTGRLMPTDLTDEVLRSVDNAAKVRRKAYA